MYVRRRQSKQQDAPTSQSLQTARGLLSHPYDMTPWALQLFCSLAVLDPRVGHTMDVLSPFITAGCHSD